jgi:hypothetical protein
MKCTRYCNKILGHFLFLAFIHVRKITWEKRQRTENPKVQHNITAIENSLTTMNLMTNRIVFQKAS